VITRTTLKALWFGGGGILATWLAVSPNTTGVPAASQTAAAQTGASAPQADELNALAARLRSRTSTAVLRPSTRNPFRFSTAKAMPSSAATRDRAGAAPELTLPAGPPPPTLALSGVAQQGGRRMAIVTGDGQIYVAGEGESVAGRYTVIKVDPEAVLLRDAEGQEQRLILPQ
jgi:hypothetical protein